jgi:hypothetical protein
MSNEDNLYHRERERHCRTLAELANDPEVRRRHEELASMHADRAAAFDGIVESTGELSAI